VFTATIGAGEQCILSVQSDRPDRTFDGIGIDPDAAVIDETGQSLSARERVADRVGELGLLADQPELGFKPGFEGLDNGPVLVLPQRAPFIGTAAPAIGLEWRRVQRCV
jgi:hypothetical protein